MEEDNKSGLEHFSNYEYEQVNIVEDNQDEGTYFRFSEGFDLGVRNVGNDQPPEQIENAENIGTNYGDSNDLRSMSSGDKAGFTNEVWFNTATDMDDPKFKTGK